jgi:hypothetical protein
MADPIEGTQMNLKVRSRRVGLDLDLGVIAHGPEQVAQAGNRTKGSPDPIRFA